MGGWVDRNCEISQSATKKYGAVAFFCVTYVFPQVDVETEGLPVVDSFWLVQHHHGPFTNLF